VAAVAVRDGLAVRPLPEDPLPFIRSQMYEPVYPQYA
jgi:hypothetical protein